MRGSSPAREQPDARSAHPSGHPVPRPARLAAVHNPKDVAISLCLEAAEVLEIMQWRTEAELDTDLQDCCTHLAEELSDVLYWVLLLAHDQQIDLGEVFLRSWPAMP